MKRKKIDENLKFHSYAEKCLREWESDGKNVKALVKELQKHKNDIIKN